MMEEIVKKHKDIFGNIINVGDYVINATPNMGRYLRCSKVTKISDSLVSLENGRSNSSNTELIKISEEQVEQYNNRFN